MNRRRHAVIWSFGLLASIAMIGCERPFIEQRAPDIEVLGPDLNVVQTERTISLRLRATSLNNVDSVLINGLPMTPESSDGIFAIDVRLGRGITSLRIRAFGSEGTVRSDTLEAVFLPVESDIAEIRLPTPRGGHTATRLLNGDLLVVGGSELPTRPAVSEALLFSAATLSSPPETIETGARRMEHTATRLPNGSVLIIGGSIVAKPTLVEQLVETVELYQPGLDNIVPVPVAGDPVRRSSHSTVLFPVRRNGQVEIFLYLYGGFGDVAYRPTPRMGIRADLRVFQFRNDSLVAAGPTFGPFIEALADHAVAAIRLPVGSDADYLFGGAYFAAEDNFDTFAFESNFSVNSGIRVDDLEPMNQPRSGHAAGRMVDGEVIIFGGRTFAPTTAMGSMEVYYSKVKRFFPFRPDVRMLQERWGHTATNWDGNRILLLGGFGFAGAGLTTSEWLVVEPRRE
ncbi:MAG: hypothetical protein ACC655_05090 [Rhodothermia bacterium]